MDVWGIDQWGKDWGHEVSWKVALVISTYAKIVRSTLAAEGDAGKDWRCSLMKGSPEKSAKCRHQ